MTNDEIKKILIDKGIKNLYHANTVRTSQTFIEKKIFNANMGDHYINRLTHTLEVSQIARSIGKILQLNDELIEAIALGHDLGHTPFGHIGERTLHEIIMNGSISEIKQIDQGFKHNFQSLRVVDELESRCENYPGLNLTLAVREGMLKHTKTTKDGKQIKYPENNFPNIDIANSKSEYIIRQLFRAYYAHPKQLPDYVLMKYCKRNNIDFNRATLKDKDFQDDPKFIRTICDHISGMTDQFAAREYFKLYVPEYK